MSAMPVSRLALKRPAPGSSFEATHKDLEAGVAAAALALDNPGTNIVEVVNLEDDSPVPAARPGDAEVEVREQPLFSILLAYAMTCGPYPALPCVYS